MTAWKTPAAGFCSTAVDDALAVNEDAVFLMRSIGSRGVHPGKLFS